MSCVVIHKVSTLNNGIDKRHVGFSNVTVMSHIFTKYTVSDQFSVLSAKLVVTLVL